MFQLVLNSIQKTVDVIAPPLDAEAEFKYHCEMIKDYFSDEQNLEEINSKLIEDTQLPKHLNELMRLLMEDNERLFFSNDENSEKDESLSASIQELNPTIRQCTETIDNQKTDNPAILNNETIISTLMECLLSNKILEIIINSAKFDLPVGIRMHCYKFLSRLLSDYKVNLLNHCSILNQINELILMCAINRAGPYEESQIQFLTVIVIKIKQNYNLIHCFTRHDFPLLSSLISMLSSPDNDIADRSGRLMIDLVSMAEDDVAKIILNRTLFKNKIIENLIYHYKQIPSTINPEDIETVLNLQDQNLNDLSSLSYQIRKILTFFKWFSFLDLVIIKCKSSSLVFNLLKVFEDEFLFNHLSVNFFDRQEINLHILSTILTFACLKHCKSIKLKESIIDYLLSEKATQNSGDLIDKSSHSNDDQSKLVENQLDRFHIVDCVTDNQQAVKRESNWNKRRILIERCKIKVNNKMEYQFLFNLDLSDKLERDVYNSYLLSLYTLQLFEEVLQSNITKELFEQLFIRNLIKRTYLNISRYNVTNDLNELEDLTKFTDIKMHSNEQSDINESNPKSLLDNPAIQSVKYFVALIPNELKSCNSDFGFEPYIEEAQKRFDECLQVCERWKWHKEIVDDFVDESTSRQSDFVESDFIAMLFDNLSNITRIPYELNLQITSLITKIALFPHPNLNEYLLNPSIPLKENCRSLFSILHNLVDQLQVEVLEVKQLKAKLNVIRTFLLGETSDLNGFQVTNRDKKILEAIIIIEEFCKELAATAIVKNSYLL